MTKLSLPAALAVLLVSSASAMALECPVPAEIDDQATASLIDEFLPQDIDLDAPEAIESAVFELKQAGVSPDLILDNLIAVHCAGINAEAGLSEEGKTQRVEAFSQSAARLVLGGTE